MLPLFNKGGIYVYYSDLRKYDSQNGFGLGNYINHTGNLRSSIGYVIVKDGRIVGKNFQLSEKEGTDKQSGKRQGEQLAMDLVRSFPKGYVLIGVAGMKYAVFVEAMENKDVLSRAADKADDFIKKHSRLLFNRLAA